MEYISLLDTRTFNICLKNPGSPKKLLETEHNGRRRKLAHHQ